MDNKDYAVLRRGDDKVWRAVVINVTKEYAQGYADALESTRTQSDRELCNEARFVAKHLDVLYAYPDKGWGVVLIHDTDDDLCFSPEDVRKEQK